MTHFEPNDEKSVERIVKTGERIERQTTLHKKHEKRKQSRQKQNEIDFRREFM